MRSDPIPTLLQSIAAVLFAIMAWMLVAPVGFHAGFAGFGEPNAHFIRDTATFVLPLAAALWLAASRPSWRVPVLGLALAQNGLHILNHLADVNNSDPSWHGPANLVALLLLEVALWQILRLQRRRETVEAAA